MEIQVNNHYGSVETVSLKEWIKDELEENVGDSGQIERMEQRLAVLSETMATLITELVEANVLPLDAVPGLVGSYRHIQPAQAEGETDESNS